MKFARSLRMTLMTVSLPSADIGLTGAITAVLISSFPSQTRNCDHARTLADSVPRAGRRRGRYGDGRKRFIEGLAPDIEPRWQAEGRTERLERFVDREAGPIGCDLEQNSAGLAEVNRLEVVALDHRRHVAPRLDQHLAPLTLMGGVGGSPGDVVHGADRLLALGPFGRLDQVEDRMLAALTGFEPGAASFLTGLAKAHRLHERVDRCPAFCHR